ncbi:hypothetical protein V2J09_017030 [Rumex salicifolius]
MEDKSELEAHAHAHAFFTNLYRETGEASGHLADNHFPNLPGDASANLLSPITDGEIWKANKSMKAFMDPGPDGYQLVFYHECWDVVVYNLFDI